MDMINPFFLVKDMTPKKNIKNWNTVFPYKGEINHLSLKFWVKKF